MFSKKILVLFLMVATRVGFSVDDRDLATGIKCGKIFEQRDKVGFQPEFSDQFVVQPREGLYYLTEISISTKNNAPQSEFEKVGRAWWIHRYTTVEAFGKNAVRAESFYKEKGQDLRTNDPILKFKDPESGRVFIYSSEKEVLSPILDPHIISEPFLLLKEPVVGLEFSRPRTNPNHVHPIYSWRIGVSLEGRLKLNDGGDIENPEGWSDLAVLSNKASNAGRQGVTHIVKGKGEQYFAKGVGLFMSTQVQKTYSVAETSYSEDAQMLVSRSRLLGVFSELEEATALIGEQ